MADDVEPAGKQRGLLINVDLAGEVDVEECPRYERLEWVAPDGTHWLWSAAAGDWAGWVSGEDGVLVLTAAEMNQAYPERPDA
jgi:hypothetical protein